MSLGPRSLAVLVTLSACARAPESEICPRIEAGDLVISELRAGQDDVGQYIELYNASGRTLDLQGVWIRQLSLDGNEHEFVIRQTLEVPNGDYVVIGPGLENPKSWVDYAVGWDIPGGDPTPEEGAEETETGEEDEQEAQVQQPTVLFRFVNGGTFEVESCDELIDSVIWAKGEIPDDGSRACGNADAPPDASANDQTDGGCWCVDAEPAEPGSPFPGIGLPGTPGSANRCP